MNDSQDAMPYSTRVFTHVGCIQGGRVLWNGPRWRLVDEASGQTLATGELTSEDYVDSGVSSWSRFATDRVR